MADRTIRPTTNTLDYIKFLELSNEYHSLQLERAREEIRNLRADLARARGHLVIRAAS